MTLAQVLPPASRRYGWVRDLPDFRDFKLSAAAPVATPALIDISAGFPLPPFDQGQSSACTAHAAVGAITFDQKKQGLPVVMMSRLYIYWFSRFLEGTTGQDSGAMLRDVMKAYNNFGICDETSWPFDLTKLTERPYPFDVVQAAGCKPVLYQSVPQTRSGIKQVLAAGSPVVFGFTVYQSFESQQVADTGIANMPEPGEQPIGGHAVVLCGADDVTQRYLVRNSWGLDWGLPANRGYFTLPYAYVENEDLADDFWVINTIS